MQIPPLWCSVSEKTPSRLSVGIINARASCEGFWDTIFVGYGLPYNQILLSPNVDLAFNVVLNLFIILLLSDSFLERSFIDARSRSTMSLIRLPQKLFIPGLFPTVVVSNHPTTRYETYFSRLCATHNSLASTCQPYASPHPVTFNPAWRLASACLIELRSVRHLYGLHL